MAFFREQFDSGAGASSGPDGFQNWTRTVHVFAEPDDFVTVQGPEGPVNVPPLPEGLVELGFAGRNSLHPYNSLLKVSGYRRGQRINEKTWDVDILYGGPGSSDPLPGEIGWRVSVRGASLTRRIIEPFRRDVSQVDPPKPGTGGGRLRPIALPIPVLGPGEEPDGIGPTIYESVPAGTAGADFYYTKTTKEGAQEQVWLLPTKRRKLVGFQTEVPAITVEFTKIVANFSLNPTAIRLADFSKAVNHATFRGADPGHVMVDTFSIAPVEVQMLGQREPGLAHRITVAFFWNAELFTPWSIVPTITDDRSFEYFVLNSDGTKVVESFRVRRTKDLNDLLPLLTEGSA